ncbi:endonuclease [Streptomyces malaysiensis]|uniref:Endonuclease n=1 Tax=Streptomyces malaysiensis subsp. samsunensis TaxID=459658 RepID=A0A9X2RU28_STRMQ|nr:endonuclease [Streptomyces samsunensis]MCQ8830383.1 endonuclease [Streptomyces samsunensis]
MSDKNESVARTLLDQQGTTFAAEAGIKLRDAPGPLYQLLVLAHLLSARIRSDIAVAAARALFDAGMRDPRRMAEADWQRRVDALGEGGYRRYDERTATQLGEAAELVNREYGGDLRRMRKAGDPKKLLRGINGIGPAGVNIFLREAQGLWPEFAPYFDRKALEGAERVGLPKSARSLAGLVAEEDLPRLAAALVRVALHADAAREVRAAA